MLYCENCGGYFDEDEAKKKYYWFDHDSIESRVCPFCESDDVVEGRKCEKCGEVKPVGTDYKILDDLCDDCADDLRSAAISLLRNHLGDDYKYILEMYQNDDLFKGEY